MFSPYLLLVNLELMVVNCLAPRHKGICGKLTGIQFGQLFPGIDIYLASYLIEAIAIAVVANVFPYRFFLRPERRPYSQRQDTRQKQHERTPKGTAESNVRRNMHHVLISII